MTYQTDIVALRAMAAQVSDRWHNRPTHELGSLPVRCRECCRRPVKEVGMMCAGCEGRYAYTGPGK